MLEVAKSILLIVSALFPIVNPIGGSPVFLSLTGDYTAPARRLLAWRVTLNSFILIVASYLVGTHILAFFGISIPVVQVGGGLIVISNGWAMLKQKDPDERGQIQKNMNPADILRRAFYPLTLPLTVGQPQRLQDGTPSRRPFSDGARYSTPSELRRSVR